MNLSKASTLFLLLHFASSFLGAGASEVDSIFFGNPCPTEESCGRFLFFFRQYPLCHYDEDAGVFETLCLTKRTTRQYLRSHAQDYCGECQPPLKGAYLTLSGAYLHSFNPLTAKVCVMINKGKYDLAQDISLSLNNAAIPRGMLEVKPESVCHNNMVFQDGENNLSFRATSTNEQAMEHSANFHAGDATVDVILRDESNDLYQYPTTVKAFLSDDKTVLESRTTSKATVTFENLPQRTIVYTAVGANNDIGISGSNPNIEDTVSIQIHGFNAAVEEPNLDFDDLLEEGWDASLTQKLAITPHEELVGPVLGTPYSPPNSTAREDNARREDDRGRDKNGRRLITDNDILLGTTVVGQSMTSHTFVTTPGTEHVHVRYRFKTEEIPGEYLGTQYNDYFAVILRSWNGGGLLVDVNTMNSLGAAAFDEDGSTSWHDASLQLEAGPTGTDSIQVDVLVANLVDGRFDSWAFVDYIAEYLTEFDEWSDALLTCSNDPLCTTGKANGGVTASHNAALLHDSLTSALLHNKLAAAANEYDIPVPVLLAMASRESSMGTSLGAAVGCPDGYGDPDDACRGYGILQVNKNEHALEGTNDPESFDHIRQAARIVVGYRSQVAADHPTWSNECVLKGALVAYDRGGAAFVQTIPDMDVGTSGDDYGSDIMAQAYWFYIQSLVS